jgi:hypothetical protein
MKLAICISGLPRSFKRTLPSLQEKILSKHDCDIFLSTWDFAVDGSRDTRVYRQDGTIQEYIDLYKPKSYEIELFNDEIREEKFKYSYYKKKYGIMSGFMPMFYKIQRANNLRLEYELKNNIKYDAVIRARSDLSYKNIIPENELILSSQGICFTRTSAHDPLTPPNSPLHISDFYFLSNSHNANIYANCYSNIESILNQSRTFIPEINLEYHLANNSIVWNHTQLITELIRD